MADFGANVLSSSVALLGLLVIMGLIYTIWSQINSPIRSRRRCFALRDSGDQVTVVSKYRKEADQHGRTQHSSYPHR